MNTDLMIWEGLSGRKYEFWVYSLKRNFAAFGAVFVYARATSSGDFNMLYANQSNRMDMVPSNPLADYIINQHGPDSLHIWKCPELKIRKEVMADLLVRHNPPGNRCV